MSLFSTQKFRFLNDDGDDTKPNRPVTRLQAKKTNIKREFKLMPTQKMQDIKKKIAARFGPCIGQYFDPDMECDLQDLDISLIHPVFHPLVQLTSTFVMSALELAEVLYLIFSLKVTKPSANVRALRNIHELLIKDSSELAVFPQADIMLFQRNFSAPSDIAQDPDYVNEAIECVISIFERNGFQKPLRPALKLAHDKYFEFINVTKPVAATFNDTNQAGPFNTLANATGLVEPGSKGSSQTVQKVGFDRTKFGANPASPNGASHDLMGKQIDSNQYDNEQFENFKLAQEKTANFQKLMGELESMNTYVPKQQPATSTPMATGFLGTVDQQSAKPNIAPPNYDLLASNYNKSTNDTYTGRTNFRPHYDHRNDTVKFAQDAPAASKPPPPGPLGQHLPMTTPANKQKYVPPGDTSDARAAGDNSDEEIVFPPRTRRFTVQPNNTNIDQPAKSMGSQQLFTGQPAPSNTTKPGPNPDMPFDPFNIATAPPIDNRAPDDISNSNCTPSLDPFDMDRISPLNPTARQHQRRSPQPDPVINSAPLRTARNHVSHIADDNYHKKLSLFIPKKFQGTESPASAYSHTLSFRDFQSYYNIPNGRRANELFKLSLSGNARTWYEQLDPNMPTEELISEFLNRFYIDLTSRSKASTQFYEFSKLDGESWAEAIQRLRFLNKTLKYSETNLLDKMVSLLPGDLKIKAAENCPTSLLDLQKMVTFYQRQGLDVSAPKPTPTKQIHIIQDNETAPPNYVYNVSYQGAQAPIQGYQRPPAPPPTTYNNRGLNSGPYRANSQYNQVARKQNNTIICRNCNGPNHFWRDCKANLQNDYYRKPAGTAQTKFNNQNYQQPYRPPRNNSYQGQQNYPRQQKYYSNYNNQAAPKQGQAYGNYDLPPQQRNNDPIQPPRNNINSRSMNIHEGPTRYYAPAAGPDNQYTQRDF